MNELNKINMNLYRILFSHTAPKDTKKGIKTYVLFKNEIDVYNFIDETFEYNGWSDRNDDGDVFDIFDDDFNVIGNENFCEKIIRIKGQMFDEDYDYSDAYYGITLYGWELVKENITNEEIVVLKNLGILYKKEGI